MQRAMAGMFPTAARAQPSLLEADELTCSMRERLERAAARMQNGGENPLSAAFSLRADQARVFERFSEYLTNRAGTGTTSNFCRIVLPPRTGKTALAGEIIGRSGLAATVIVPTRILVQQTRRLLGEMLPRTPIGVLSGEERSVVARGVNVTTYAMLQRLGAAAVPPALRRAALVFVDEAHRAMTSSRIALLGEAFEPEALRIALTATPDYDAERRLCRFFPDLIHEVSLGEALDLELLAPVRVWVAEVDHAGSAVRMAAGDYQRDTLGRLMSAAPFFKAAQLFRYERGNREKAALLCCSTRQQAYDLTRFLEVHRPLEAPPPALLLGETSREEREAALAKFEAGEIDTLIQVGVLIEGWSSPRCKLLIDLAPSVSRVRATQKYFRAMTRRGDEEARIYVILPRDLPALPTLPTDLFGTPVGGYLAGTLLGETEPGAGEGREIEEHLSTPVAGVRLRQRILLTAKLRKPALRRGDRLGLVRVLASCADFDPSDPPGRYRFRALLFMHPLFTGRGEALLEWLGFPPTELGYAQFLWLACPDAVGSRLIAMLGPGEHSLCAEPCDRDIEVLEQILSGKERRTAKGAAATKSWQALGGHRAQDARLPLDLLLEREHRSRPSLWLPHLTARRLAIVERRFGLHGEDPLTLEQLGEREGVTRERIRSIEATALRKLRQLAALRPLDEQAIDGGRAMTVGFARQPPVHGPPAPPPSARARRWASTVFADLAKAEAPLSMSEIGAHLEASASDVAQGIRVLLEQRQIAPTRDGYVVGAQGSRPSW